MSIASPDWWQVLPPDFYRQPHRTEMDDRHPFKVQATAAADVLMRTGLASTVMLAMLPQLLSRERREQELAWVSFYQEQAHGRADEVFRAPPSGVEVFRGTPGLLGSFGARPPDARVDRLRFFSPYEALNPALRADYRAFTQNHHVAAEHWRHPDGPRKTLIFLHGYFLDAYWINSLMFSLRWFYAQGYDILLYTLPFHGSRRAPFEPFSGFGYFSNGMAHVNEAMLQAIHDLRVWMDYLEGEGVTTMGVSGLSLGGYLSALATSVEPRLKFAIPNAPVVLPMDMIMEWPPLSVAYRHLLAPHGLDIVALRHFMALHCPLTYTPVIEPERLLVIGGAGDRFTAPRYVNLLHEHWAGSQMHWFPGNHVFHLQQREYLRLMRDFMNRCCAA
ncbi:MAG: alpha/beta hydrolase family protein [Moraxellaceae bacterium]|nr:alpha/beta hydrolase family protein [Moraxellaceae bacterium]